MTPTKILWNDIIKGYGTLLNVVGTTEVAHPLVNFTNDKKSLVWRSTPSTSNTIAVRWTSVRSIGAVGIAFSNMVAGNTVAIRLYDLVIGGNLIHDTGNIAIPHSNPVPSGFTSLGLASFPYGGGTYFSTFFPTVNAVRRMEVDFNTTGNPDGYVEVARIVAGVPETMQTTPDYGLEWASDNRTVTFRFDSGDRAVERRTQSKRLKMPYSQMNQAEQLIMSNIQRINGTHTPVFINTFPDALDELNQKGQIYGGVSPTSILFSAYNLYSTVIDIDEI